MATFFLSILAVYALSWSLVYSDGAWGLLERFRSIKWVDSFGVLNCIVCTAFWVSIVVYFLPFEAVFILGMWGAVVVLEQTISNLMVK